MIKFAFEGASPQQLNTCMISFHQCSSTPSLRLKVFAYSTTSKAFAHKLAHQQPIWGTASTIMARGSALPTEIPYVCLNYKIRLTKRPNHYHGKQPHACTLCTKSCDATLILIKQRVSFPCFFSNVERERDMWDPRDHTWSPRT